MKKNVDNRIDESISKSEVAEGINTMLECLLSQDKFSCKKCRECEKVDACCFLMESVFVYKHIKMNKIKN
jgi:hypothetical protein